MKKKIIGGVLIAFLMMLVTVSITIADKTTPEVKSLSMAQAKELAMENNAQIELAGLGAVKADLALEKAMFSKEKLLKAMDKRSLAKTQDEAFVIDVVPKQAEAGKIIADAGKIYTENSILYGVEASYYSVLRGEKMRELSLASYKRAEEQWKQAQAKFKAGTVAKIDVISAEAQLKSAEADLNESEASVQKVKMALNQTLGLNIDTPIQLTDKFDFATVKINLDQELQDVINKDLPLISARETYNVNQINFDYYKKYYTTNTFVYRDAEYQFKDAEVNFKNAKSKLELNVKTAYLDLKTAEDNYLVLTKSMEQAKEAHRLTKLRYNVGMATNYDVLNAEEILKQAELGLTNAIYNNNLAIAQFTYGIFGGSSSPSASN